MGWAVLVMIFDGHVAVSGAAIKASDHLPRDSDEFTNLGEGHVFLINERSDCGSTIGRQNPLELAESRGGSNAERSSAAHRETLNDLDETNPIEPFGPSLAQGVHGAIKRLVQIVRCAHDPSIDAMYQSSLIAVSPHKSASNTQPP